MGPKRAWILNLDADDELGDPGSSTSRATRARIAELAQRIPALLPRRDADPSAGISEFDRIRDHVEQHLLAGASIGDKLRQA